MCLFLRKKIWHIQTTIDDLPNVSNGRVTTTIEVPHAANHNSANQAIERIEGYVGVSSSEDTGTITGKIKQNAANIALKQNLLTAGNALDLTSDVISAKNASDSQSGVVQTDGITTKIVSGKLTAAVCDCTETSIDGILKGNGENILAATPDVDYLTPETAASSYLTSSDLPLATSSTVGVVKPDGKKITIDENGVITTAGSGTGDVNGPATNSADYIPQWDGANSKLLKDGLAVPEGGLAGLTALSLKQDSLGFTPEDVANKVTAFQVTPDDTHYISEKLAKDSLDAKDQHYLQLQQLQKISI